MGNFSAVAVLSLLLCFFAPQAWAKNASCEAVMAGKVRRASVLDRAACGIIARGEAGDIEAQYEAGLVYLWGVDTLQADPNVAAAWFLKAAEGGQPEAAYRLAALYVSGHGVRQNLEEMRKWLDKAASAGLGMAMFELGGVYEYSIGVKADPDAAQEWYDRARESHNFEAERAVVLEERALFDNPWEAARSGNAKAQYYAGMAKQQEARSELDPAKKRADDREWVAWLTQSAEAGYVPAQTNLGLAYVRGINGKIDEVAGVAWLEKAARQGDAEASFHLSFLYASGLGVEKDEKKAVALLTWAAEHEYTEAQRFLATMYETGMGVRADRDRARQWHRRSAPQSNVALRDMLRLTDVP